MILLFSAMSFAQTDTSVDNETKNYVNNKINEPSTKKNQTTTSSYELEKLKLVRQWINAKENGNDTRTHELMEKITRDFPSDDEYTKSVTNMSLNNPTTKTNPFVHYIGSTEKHWDCHNDSDLLGYIYSTITGYHSAIYTVTNMHYPYEVGSG